MWIHAGRWWLVRGCVHGFCKGVAKAANFTQLLLRSRISRIFQIWRAGAERSCPGNRARGRPIQQGVGGLSPSVVRRPGLGGPQNFFDRWAKHGEIANPRLVVAFLKTWPAGPLSFPGPLFAKRTDPAAKPFAQGPDRESRVAAWGVGVQLRLPGPPVRLTISRCQQGFSGALAAHGRRSPGPSPFTGKSRFLRAQLRPFVPDTRFWGPIRAPAARSG